MVTDTPTGAVRTDCLAAWVNASRRRDYTTEVTGATSTEPSDGETIGISCFVIAPPYRRMYEERGFQLVEERDRDRVVRIRA